MNSTPAPTNAIKIETTPTREHVLRHVESVDETGWTKRETEPCEYDFRTGVCVTAFCRNLPVTSHEVWRNTAFGYPFPAFDRRLMRAASRAKKEAHAVDAVWTQLKATRDGRGHSGESADRITAGISGGTGKKGGIIISLSKNGETLWERRVSKGWTFRHRLAKATKKAERIIDTLS